MGSITPYTNAVPAIVPDEEDLPGWVPKNYIEKGNVDFIYLILIVFKILCCTVLGHTIELF